MKRLQQMLETQKKLLADESKKSNEFAMTIDRDRKTATDNQKKIEDTKKNRDELDTQLKASLERRAELQAMLDKTPNRSAPAPAKTVTIPNPRPAPPGARRVNFICVGNRLYPMNLDEFRKDAETKAKQLIVKRRLNHDAKKGIDPEKFENYYSKLKSTPDDFFDIEYYVSGNRWPRIRLVPNGRGATEEALRNRRSKIRRLLGTLDPQKFYAFFYVMPDSFDVYLSARQVMAEAGILAGWDPQGDKFVYTAGVGGGIELGPPRPPNPNPPPPAKPTKPANVID